MEPVIMFLTWRWEADHGLCMVGPYLRDQAQPCRTFMLMPIAVVEMDMQACVHVGWVGVMHRQMTGSPQTWLGPSKRGPFQICKWVPWRP